MRVTLQQGRAISSGCSLRTHTGPRCHERLGTRSHRPAASGISTWSYYCNMNCVESMAGTRESLFHYRITRKLVKGPALHTQYICKKPCAVDIECTACTGCPPQAAFVSPIELYGCTVSLTHSDLSQAPCRRPLETRPLVTVHLRPWRSTSASRPHERAAHSERLKALEAACVEGSGQRLGTGSGSCLGSGSGSGSG